MQIPFRLVAKVGYEMRLLACLVASLGVCVMSFPLALFSKNSGSPGAKMP